MEKYLEKSLDKFVKETPKEFMKKCKGELLRQTSNSKEISGRFSKGIVREFIPGRFPDKNNSIWIFQVIPGGLDNICNNIEGKFGRISKGNNGRSC